VDFAVLLRWDEILYKCYKEGGLLIVDDDGLRRAAVARALEAQRMR
jgi:hypothetical protein